MFALVIFFLSCSEYAFAQHMNTTCVKVFQSEKYDAAPIPDEQELNYMCPDIIKYLDCYWNELQEDPEKYSDSQHFYYTNTGELLRDFCTDGSQIRQDYLSSLPCFKNVQRDYATCQDEIKPLYERWKVVNPEEDPRIDELQCFMHLGPMVAKIKDQDEIKPLYEQWKVVNPDEDPRIDELQCFLHSQTMGCLAHRINQTCGVTEYSTYLEILERSRYVRSFCGPVSEDTLESEYLDLLNFKRKDVNMQEDAGDANTEVYVLTTNSGRSSSMEPQSALIKTITYFAFWITLKLK